MKIEFSEDFMRVTVTRGLFRKRVGEFYLEKETWNSAYNPKVYLNPGGGLYSAIFLARDKAIREREEQAMWRDVVEVPRAKVR